MYPTPHRTHLIITSAATASIAVGAHAAAVNRWRRCKTIKREAVSTAGRDVPFSAR